MFFVTYVIKTPLSKESLVVISTILPLEVTGNTDGEAESEGMKEPQRL